MSIVILTPPATEPVSVAEAKLHCRVDQSDEDALFARLIETARSTVESLTGLALLNQRVRQSVRLPTDSVDLALGPLRSIVQIRSLVESTPTVLAASRYETVTQGLRSCIIWRGGAPAFPIEIDFDCGFGESAASVPASLRQVTLELIAHRYADREGASPPGPHTLALLAPYLKVRL